MMSEDDLFGVESRLQRLPADDADLAFCRQISLPVSEDALLHELLEQTPWRSELITLWGKTHVQPRLTAWYGDDCLRYAYSGLDLNPLPWTPRLIELRDLMQELSGERFNSVLLNHYRNEQDSVGMHSDDETMLGPTPAIASLSLGATRTFVLKHKHRMDLRPMRLALHSGSVLLMKGQTQQFWKHGIDKLSTPCGPRVNLTFRRVYGRREPI
jgi:alkylated DNA repair dioxygenase AlkB